MQEALRRAALSPLTIAAGALAAATPLTVAAGLVPTGIAQTGSNGFPWAFLAIGAVMALWSVGYLDAARRYPADDANSTFYCLIRHGLGRVVGVGAGWVALGAYTALTIGLYGLIGSTVSPLLSSAFGVSVPWQAIAIVAVGIVGWLTYTKVELRARLLKVLVSLEIAIISAVTIANLVNPAPGAAPRTVLNPAATLPSLAVTSAVLAIAVLGYVGSELTVAHAHEARDGHRGVSRATKYTIAALTILYSLAALGLAVTYGPGQLAAATADPAGMFVGSAQANLGAAVATVAQILFSTSVLAGAISFHRATSLYAHNLGRDRTAPAFLRRVNRHGSPVAASLTQTLLGLVAIIVVSVVGGDPVLVLFYLGGTAGAIGILTLLTVTGVAAAVIVVRDRDTGPHQRSALHRRWAITASILSAVLLGSLTTTAWISLDTLLGVGPDSSIPTGVRLAYLTVFLVGVVWALVLRARRPQDYAVIATTTHQPAGAQA